jgi:5'(3')-deoxyribonucleotidase
MKHNIGIDLDGVVCDVYDEAFANLKRMYPAKVIGDSFSESWEKEFGLSEAQVHESFIDMGKRGFFRKAKIYAGAKEVLYKLDRRYNIFFISWRNYIPNAWEDTLYWLDSNKLPYERLVMTNNKYKVATKERFVFFLDDNVQQCNRLCKTLVPTFLFDRPWNKKEPTDALVKTVRSWKDVEKILSY